MRRMRPCPEDEDDTNVVAEVRKCPVSNAEAMNMLDKCLTWLRWQPEASLANTSTLVQLREMAAVKREALRTQPTIDPFVKCICVCAYTLKHSLKKKHYSHQFQSYFDCVYIFSIIRIHF